MKKKITIIAMVLLFLFTTISNANTLSLNMSVNKNKISKGENFKVKVDWKENMQAADFSLKYDSNVLEFVGADIQSNFYNLEELGKLNIVWFSIDDTDKTNIEFEFKAKKTGKATVSTEIDAGFADKDLNQPDDYKDGVIEIKVNSKVPYSLIIIILIIVIAILTLVLMKKKNKKNKSKRRK